MKKICFVNPSSIFGRFGGAEVQIYILAKEAVNRGWDVYYLTSRDQFPKENTTGIKFVTFKTTGLPDVKNQSTNLADAEQKSFIDTLNEINPDYIYQRGRKLWTYYCGLFSKTSNSKFIFAASMDIDCYKHKFLFRRPSSLWQAYERIKNWKFISQLDRNTLEGIKNADLVLSQTNTQKNLFKKNLNIQSKIFPNIHPKADKIKSKPEQSTITVLWIARVRAWKQPEIFIKLAYACRDLDCQFLMAGRLSDSKYQEHILKAQDELKNFKYVGGVPFDESNQLIQNSDLFINTSKEDEGFPNTYIQSWLRKVPVIALNFDPDDIIKNHKLGAVANNFSSLVDVTKELITNSELRKKIGENAFNFAVDRFSVESNINNFFTTIQEINDTGDQFEKLTG